jgi:acyl-CoA reductase-like NAD-dependent aldehyde dehydrogenase
LGNEYQRVLTEVVWLVDDGELVFGGKRLKRDAPGFYLQPALFTGVTNKMRIAREELSGPVAGVICVDDYARSAGHRQRYRVRRCPRASAPRA